MTIVTRQHLIAQRNLTLSFIRKHDRDMGGRGRPRRYDLELVDDFLHRYFREELARETNAERNVEKLVRDIDTYIATTRTKKEWPREMVGRGGNTRQEATR